MTKTIPAGQKALTIVLSCFLLLLLGSCTGETSSGWSTYIGNTGTYSSPRTVDLNNDQIPDIVIGAGGKEKEYSDTAVLALDGATGKILWAIPGINQYVGSAVFKDINGDNIPDVFIGGRWAQLSAINGADGKTLWTFFPERQTADGNDGGWFNFTTPQFIPDQDNDGVSDLLIANGGDARLAASDINRPAGRIMVLSSRTGQVLAYATVPDGKETYLSVVCEERKDKNWPVYFGTGGETLGGHLYRTSLQDIMKGNISSAKILASSAAKGFVASPVLVDITNDGVKDIVVNAVDGRLLAIDGSTDSLLWQVQFPGTEAYTIPAPGFYIDEHTPGFFCNFAIGIFPNVSRSLRFMVDGRTGTVLYRDTIPSFQYASPVSADLNGDGYDEAIVNQSELKRRQFDNIYYSYLLAFDFRNHRNYSLGDTIRATNLASTPWLGDLDGDNNYDIIYSAVQYENAQFDLEKPLGLFINRKRTDIPVKKKTLWGAFMGSRGLGVFDAEKGN